MKAQIEWNFNNRLNYWSFSFIEFSNRHFWCVKFWLDIYTFIIKSIAATAKRPTLTLNKHQSGLNGVSQYNLYENICEWFKGFIWSCDLWGLFFFSWKRSYEQIYQNKLFSLNLQLSFITKLPFNKHVRNFD